MEEEEKEETKSGGGRNSGCSGAENGEGKLTAKGIRSSGEGQVHVDSDGDYQELPKELRGLEDTVFTFEEDLEVEAFLTLLLF